MKSFYDNCYSRMCDLIIQFVLHNKIIDLPLFGQSNVIDLIHNTSINSLNKIRIQIKNKIDNLEATDEWSDPESATVIDFKDQYELVNLIIGYRKHLDEVSIRANERLKLLDELNKLKEAQKTPQQKIQEIEEQLNKML